MCPTYRCPIDETVFQTKDEDRMPTLEGHPECPGPVCSEKFGTSKASKSKASKSSSGAFDSPDPNASAPPFPIGQGW